MYELLSLYVKYHRGVVCAIKYFCNIFKSYYYSANVKFDNFNNCTKFLEVEYF